MKAREPVYGKDGWIAALPMVARNDAKGKDVLLYYVMARLISSQGFIC
jgi:hypothetical protein